MISKIQLTRLTSGSCFYYYYGLLVYYGGLVVFLSGFLLNRSELTQVNQVPLSNVIPQDNQIKSLTLLLVDGLGYNLSQGVHSLNSPTEERGKLVKFLADPPTTTLQRLKGLLTGSMPTFVDIGSNFGGAQLTEDNLIAQWRRNNKTIAFVGDDTWIDLFQDKDYYFTRVEPHPSFNIRDLDTVDLAVKTFFLEHMQQFDVMIGHMLGIDHCGHTYGRDHVEMRRKLYELDQFIGQLKNRLPDDTLLVVFGDHGMTVTGDHGGASSDETEAALYLWCKRCQFSSASPGEVWQIDLVPYLAMMSQVPIPFSNLGVLPESLLPLHLRDTGPSARLANWHQTQVYIENYAREFGMQPESVDRSSKTSQDMRLVQAWFRDKWTRFDLSRMLHGVLLAVAGLWTSFRRDNRPISLALLGCLILAFLFQASMLPILVTALCCTGLIFFHANIPSQIDLKNIPSYVLVLGASYAAIFTGNSFVVQETSVLVYLVQTMFILRALGQFHKRHHDWQLVMPELLVSLFLTRQCLYWESCREESPGSSKCFRPDSGGQPQDLASYNVLFDIFGLPLLLAFLPSRLLEHHGSKTSANQVLMSMASLCLAVSWMLDSVVKNVHQLAARWPNLPGQLDHLNRWRVSMASLSFAVSVSSLVFLYLRPLTVQAEENRRKKSMSVYGSSTCYSAWLLLHSIYSLLILLVLVGVVHFRSVLLFLGLAVCVAWSWRRLANGKDVFCSWRSSLMLALLVQLAFFVVAGHQTTISAIPWSAAFTMSLGEHWSRVVPGLMVLGHLFGSTFVLASLAPLICVLLPMHFWVKSRVMLEMGLVDRDCELPMLDKRDTPQRLSLDLCSVLRILYRRVILIMLVWTLASVLSTALLRRHLMVWKIFVPRLLFMILQSLAATLAFEFNLCIFQQALHKRLLKFVSNIYK